MRDLSVLPIELRRLSTTIVKLWPPPFVLNKICWCMMASTPTSMHQWVWLESIYTVPRHVNSVTATLSFSFSNDQKPASMRHAIILGAWILQLVVAAHAVELHALHRRHWKSRGAGDSIHFRKPDRNGSQHNGTNDCHHITPGADNSSSIALKSSDEMIWTSLNGRHTN